jgi:hypothetical protein
VQRYRSRIEALLELVHDPLDGVEAAKANILGGRPYGRAIAELTQIDEHRLAEVSTAIVIRASALGTEAFRSDALAQSLGLRVLH